MAPRPPIAYGPLSLVGPPHHRSTSSIWGLCRASGRAWWPWSTPVAAVEEALVCRVRSVLRIRGAHAGNFQQGALGPVWPSIGVGHHTGTTCLTARSGAILNLHDD
jgi:hypothetical protein